MNSLKRRRAVIVTVFIAIAVIILLAFVFTLGSQNKAFVKRIPVRAIFPDISGLKEGNNVWFSGVKVGTVKDIELKPNSQVEVTLNIEHTLESFIHKDAKVKLSSEGVLGNKIVVISGGTPGTPFIERNDLLKTENTLVSTDDLFTTFQVNNNNLVAITENLKSVTDKLARGEGSIGKLIHDDALVSSIERTVQELNTTVVNFKEVSIKSERAIANVDAFTKRLNAEGTSINRLMEDTAIFYDLKRSVADLKAATANANNFTATLKDQTTDLLNRDNAVNVLLKDETAAAQLRSIMKNLESSSIKLDENLEALQHNFLLRGFFRKRAKQNEQKN